MIDHRGRMTDDGVRCSCGSDGCVVTAVGVWTPSRTVNAAEWAEAFATFGSQSTEAFVRRSLDKHRGHGGALVAEHDSDESLYWRFTPSVALA